MIYIICVINGRKTRERYALSKPDGFNCNHVMNCCHNSGLGLPSLSGAK